MKKTMIMVALRRVVELPRRFPQIPDSGELQKALVGITNMP